MKKVQLAITREEAEFILDCLYSAKNESVELMDYNQKKINEVSSGETIYARTVSRNKRTLKLPGRLKVRLKSFSLHVLSEKPESTER